MAAAHVLLELDETAWKGEKLAVWDRLRECCPNLPQSRAERVGGENDVRKLDDVQADFMASDGTG